MILISIFVTLLLHFATGHIFYYLACVDDATYADGRKQVAETCFAPNVTNPLDLRWFLGSQPKDGYYVAIANDIARRHFAEILHGQLLTLQDDFTDTCYRANGQLGGQGLVANVSGFNGLRGAWNCKVSTDYIGLLLCNGISSGPSKFHEKFNVYPVFTDLKNFVLKAVCFSNGEAGWAVLSVKPTLSDKDITIIADKVNQLGFRFEDHVTTFSESCEK